PARIARAAGERPRQRRAAEAGRGAGRRASPFASVQRRLSRPGALVDAEGGLGRALGLDQSARALMNQLPLAARAYVSAVIAVGLALLVVFLPSATFDQPVLLIALLL